MVQSSQAFRTWLKSANNMKLSSDSAVNRILHEGITNFESFADFDKKSIERLPSVCKESIDEIEEDDDNGIEYEAAVNGATISSISVRRLIVAVQAAKYYELIGRTMGTGNMHYMNVLKNFKMEYDSYIELKNADEPSIPKVNDRDNDRKITHWAPAFKRILSSCYGSNGPLSYVLRDDPTVPPEDDDPLGASGYCSDANGSLISELIARLPHNGPIYKNDNEAVFMKIEEAVRGTSVESTIKSFSRSKDGRGAYFALITNHAGNVKYRSIAKKCTNLLHNIKWNGRAYPLESHVSNHRKAYDDLIECSKHIPCTVPSAEQRVEYLIDSISSTDATLQAAIGIVRANTNNMRNDFESAASSLIEVDPYRRAYRPARSAQISAIDFSAGRGNSGVDLRWHSRKQFLALPQNQKDELSEWLNTDAGKKKKKEYFDNKNSGDQPSKRKPEGEPNNAKWKKQLRKKIKSPKGLATVMSLLAKEEQANQAVIAAMTTNTTDVALPPPPTPNPPAVPNTAGAPSTTAHVGAVEKAFPATTTKLTSILKNKKL